MSIFSYHIVQTSLFNAIQFRLQTKKLYPTKGLIDFEWMTEMELDSPIYSLKRFNFTTIILFAQWENEEAIQQFLQHHSIGKIINQGWSIHMGMIRKWGNYKRFHSENTTNNYSINQPIIGFTIADMAITQIPRFIRWGKPVEALVKNHPNCLFSTASIRFSKTISTFSIWENEKAMADMVNGHSKVDAPKRHLNAMKEREHQDFYTQFSTFRFYPIAEYGTLNGKQILNNSIQR